MWEDQWNSGKKLQGKKYVASGLSIRKKLLYGVLVTVLFFAALEFLLAILDAGPQLGTKDPYVGFEASLPLFVEQDRNGEIYLQTAKNKLAYFNRQSFPKRKSKQTYRIFCLGGSTTYGRPYNDMTSFCGWLRELLPAIDARHDWEVINAGGISYASYRVAAVLEEICHYSPDLVIVYTGHNEFLEEHSYRDLKSTSKSMRRLTAWLYRSRTFSLLNDLISDSSVSNERWLLPGEVDAILDHDSGPNSYHRDEKLRADILAHFEFNLGRILNTARASGAEVMLVSPAKNLKDFSPFKSEANLALSQADERRWFELFKEATQHLQLDDTHAALATIEQIATIDEGRADLHFLRGQVLLKQARFAEARAAFLRAIDQDVCPLRAISEIPAIIERTAIAQRVPLIDFASIIDNDCQRLHGHRCPGQEYFLDHVHPTIESHRLLAMALVEALSQRKILRPDPDWRDGALAAVSRKIEARIDPDFQSRALTNLAQVLSWAGKQEEAGPLALQAVAMRVEHELPDDPECQFYAAVYLAMQGASDQALALLTKVVERAPNNAQAHWRLATLYFEKQMLEDAHTHLRKAMELQPDDAALQKMLEVVEAELDANRP